MQRVEKDFAPVDEFALYCIGRMFNKHIIVLTSQEPWSTLSRQFQMSAQEVYAKSDIRLIFLGPGKYAEIRSNCETATPLSSPVESTKATKPTKSAATSKGTTKGKSHIRRQLVIPLVCDLRKQNRVQLQPSTWTLHCKLPGTVNMVFILVTRYVTLVAPLIMPNLMMDCRQRKIPPPPNIENMWHYLEGKALQLKEWLWQTNQRSCQN